MTHTPVVLPHPLPAGTAICPVCNGTGHQAVAPELLPGYEKYNRVQPDGTITNFISGFNPGSRTLDCRNCGGQGMAGQPNGYTAIDPATGLGCTHTFKGHNAGRCYTVYECTKGCGTRYAIDSGD